MPVMSFTKAIFLSLIIFYVILLVYITYGAPCIDPHTSISERASQYQHATVITGMVMIILIIICIYYRKNLNTKLSLYFLFIVLILTFIVLYVYTLLGPNLCSLDNWHASAISSLILWGIIVVIVSLAMLISRVAKNITYETNLSNLSNLSASSSINGRNYNPAPSFNTGDMTNIPSSNIVPISEDRKRRKAAKLLKPPQL